MRDPAGDPAPAAGLAALGPFFAVGTHDDGAAPRDGWRPMSELLDGPGVLAERVARTRAALAAAGGVPVEAVEPRIAVSVTHLGLVARLMSPVLGAAALAGIVPELDPATTHWRPVVGGPVPLSVPAGLLCPPAPAAAAHRLGGVACLDGVHGLAARVLATVLHGPVSALTRAAGTLSVSPLVLWGNVASAVNGATTMITAARPDLATRSAELAGLLLDSPALAEATLRTRPFRRRSCCLIYRAAPGGQGAVCGDCVLLERRPPSD